MRKIGRSFIGATATVACIAAGFACSADQNLVSPAQHDAISSADAERAGEFAANFKLARERARPYVRIHHEAMKDLRMNYLSYMRGEGSINERTCRAATAIAEKAGASYGTQAWTTRSDAERAQLIRIGLSVVPNCGTSIEANVWGSHGLPSAVAGVVASRSTTQQVSPFGETYQLYYGVIVDVIYSWDGDVSLQASVDSAIAAMALQYPLTLEETEALAVTVELAESSFEDAMLLSYPDNWNDTYEISSIFAANRMWPWRTVLKKVAITVLSDIASWSATALVIWTATRDDEDYDWGEVVEGGMIAAAGGSALMAMNCLNNTSPCKSDGSP